MARKVFISFLGKSDYTECKYGSPNSEKLKYIQEATLIYLDAKQWSSDSIAYILLTEDAETANWNDDGHVDNNTKEKKKNQGLKTRLDLMGLPFPVEPIDKLPNGNTEGEIWTIFKRVFDKIEKDDELYFDLTHGFRYLPMLILVLGNYSKFLKNVKIMSITYGNFESRQNDVAPIIDITSLSLLQDWTFAAGTYLDSGGAKKLVEMKDVVKSDELQKIIDLINIVTKERQTCRGLQIHTSENLSVLQSSLYTYLENKDSSNPEEEPLRQVLNKVDKSLKNFDKTPNFMNGFHAAKWCVENGLFQQAITLLRENFVTLFCERNGIDIADKKMRDIVEYALNVQINHNENKPHKWPDYDKLDDDQRCKISVVLQDEWFKPEGKHNNRLVHLYREIRDYRNNFNHAGFNTGASSPEVIEAQVNEFVNRAVNLFQKK